jgi:hypothetical protein
LGLDAANSISATTYQQLGELLRSDDEMVTCPPFLVQG